MLDHHARGLELRVMKGHQQGRPTRGSAGHPRALVACVDVRAESIIAATIGGRASSSSPAGVRTKRVAATRGQVQGRTTVRIFFVDVRPSARVSAPVEIACPGGVR